MATRKRSSSKRKTKKERLQEMEQAEALRREITLWIIIAVSLLLFISNLGFGGFVGKFVSGILFGIFGLVAYVFPILLLVGSFFAISNRGNSFAILKIVAASVFAIFICFFLSLLYYGNDVATPAGAYLDSSKDKTSGGIVGGTIAYILVPAVGIIGSYIIDMVVLIISLVIITGKSAIKGMRDSSIKVYESAKETNERQREYREYKAKERNQRRMDRKVTGVSLDTKIEDKSSENKIKTDEMGEIHIENYPEFPEVKEETSVKISSMNSNLDSNIEADIDSNIDVDMIKATVRDIEIESETEPEEAVFEEPVVKERKVKKALPEDELSKETSEVAQIIEENSEITEYGFPPTSLLKKGAGNKVASSQSELRETAQKLEQILQIFGVGAKVTNISCGPAVTRFEIQPEMGVKVSKIVGLADDIKLNLAAADIRIEAPIPGKAAVGIEVPNKENVMVSFRDLIESDEFVKSKSKISFAVGKDIGGKTKVTDIAKMPHLLIAGATGSGKSVCINTIIMSILYKARPDEVKLIMIDPKVVELSVYNGIPHLMIPVVTDPKKAAGALNWAVMEMTDRYNKFAESGVREINGYNQRVDTIEVPEGQERPAKMPQIVIIVDELADLMMVASKEVEESICRLAQLARAAGIHLIIATQRPSVNVITGLIKANMPSRIAFAVTSGIDSRTILDTVGAEKLLGKGDMLFDPQGAPKPMRVQGAFVSDEEVAAVVNYIKDNNGQASTDESILQKIDQAQNANTVVISDSDGSDDGRDAYFMEAAKIIIDKDKASIGMLQRYLKVGFNRAARIMDQLEEAGIVGPELGTKPRTVIMDEEQFQAFIDESM
ncbi:MAG: DNA translocase FtsK [Agathobacter sp.]|nr:DNA translocase FtsK [Agathobacter sp.]